MVSIPFREIKTQLNHYWFISVGASLARLQKWAEESSLNFLLDSQYLEDKLDTLHPIAHDPLLSPITPYQYIYNEYNHGTQLCFIRYFHLILGNIRKGGHVREGRSIRPSFL